MLICPTTDFHFAVPVLRILKDETPVIFSSGAATLLWEAYNIWYYDGRVSDLRYVCVLNRVTLWSSLMDFLVRTTFSSVNEIWGILALRRTIARCLPIYVTLALAALDSEFFGFLQWRVCVEQSRLWDQALEEEAETSTSFFRIDGRERADGIGVGVAGEGIDVGKRAGSWTGERVSAVGRPLKNQRMAR